MSRSFVAARRATTAAAAAAFVAGPALGAGFALQENSPSGLGNADAGGAAAAADASTLWANAAGKTRLDLGQAAGAGTRPLLDDHPNYVFPSERVKEIVDHVCGSFGIPTES